MTKTIQWAEVLLSYKSYYHGTYQYMCQMQFCSFYFFPFTCASHASDNQATFRSGLFSWPLLLSAFCFLLTACVKAILLQNTRYSYITLCVLYLQWERKRENDWENDWEGRMKRIAVRSKGEEEKKRSRRKEKGRKFSWNENSTTTGVNKRSRDPITAHWLVVWKLVNASLGSLWRLHWPILSRHNLIHSRIAFVSTCD